MLRQGLRSFASLVLFFTMIVVATSGLVLWLGPHGGPGESGSGFLGIGKGVWKQSHIYVSLLLLAAGIIHLVFNWTLLWGYVWRKNGALRQAVPLCAALALTVGVVLAASFLAGGGPDQLGKMTLQSIAQSAGRPVEEVIAVFESEGILAPGPTASIIDLAMHNRVPAPSILAVVEKHWPGAMRPGPRRPH